jgi:dihydroorotate dehydrogenase electron transfer subunit
MNDAIRNTIFVEDATVIHQLDFPEDQFILRLHAPQCAAQARPGMFAHVRCDADIPMRRPLSIMRSAPGEGSVDFFYKIAGPGLQALSQAETGDRISILGPIGNGFRLHQKNSVQLMIGGGVGIPPIVFLAEHLRRGGKRALSPAVFMGSELPFPFETTPSVLPLTGISQTTTATMPLLEDLEIPARLASLQGYAGCYQGNVTDLARDWLESLRSESLREIEVFACGPEPMLHAVALMASEFGLPCQLCLEEYMACAVGGCAGCTVAVHTNSGVSMKRVCVDGPVFEAAAIYTGEGDS